jgi:hypothetical protein
MQTSTLLELQSELRYCCESNKNEYKSLTSLWREAIEILRYVLYLPEWELPRLRMHCGLFTGQTPWQYWYQLEFIDISSAIKQTGYIALTQDIPEIYHLYEPLNPHIPRPMGLPYNGKAINFDVARFQSVVTNLFLTGEMTRLQQKSNSNRLCMVEIGSGYGGMAFHLCRLFQKKVTYVLVDIPEILMFAAAYLNTHLENPSIIFAKSPEELKQAYEDGVDVVMVSSFSKFVLDGLPEVDLAVNLVSFQEMQPTEVSRYCNTIFPKLDGIFYSDNIDSHKFNDDGKLPLSTLFSSYGQLYPDVSVYQSLVAKYKWTWFYSIYMLAKPQRIAGLNKNLRGMSGDGKSGKPFVIDNKNIKLI